MQYSMNLFSSWNAQIKDIAANFRLIKLSKYLNQCRTYRAKTSRQSFLITLLIFIVKNNGIERKPMKHAEYIFSTIKQS